MPRLIILAAAGTLALATAAQAQIMHKSMTAGMTADDNAAIRAAVQTALHGDPAGHVRHWTTAAGGKSGTVKVLSRHGGDVRLRIAENVGGTPKTLYTFTYRKGPDGRWGTIG